ncbi:cyclic lactone autoinducer peptide [Clostridium grantii]|uniref:Cyclic lactone autoinducer peptide n=1 Tax=Clostridium grantii DSM 8605 TaxID=1121316 RepID=A0A1M5QK28_9CLOT|nr:cyclic lactone autoinducer peptide [Clostridium grantii]SHH14447.1 cyclic lactone autoinducer peptide [Clostridium grantii DSM 8605]
MKFKKALPKFLATVFTILAVSSASSACYFFTYQPQEPKSLRD